jgi:hypothetical protein
MVLQKQYNYTEKRNAAVRPVCDEANMCEWSK